MYSPQFPSNRVQKGGDFRGQFYSEVNTLFRKVKFILPLVEKYLFECHFLKDFLNKQLMASIS